MVTISATTDDIIERCQQVLSQHGRLSTAIPGFTPRSAQVQLCLAIAEASLSKSILVAEAGTGTGKTYAYLIPCLLSGKKALISTATKTLQDQLFDKDLPMLIRALGLSVRVQNLKGRANYICLHRSKLHAEEGRFVHAQQVHEILHVREKIAQLKEGVRAELPEIAEDSDVWSYVTSTVDNCLGNDCESYKDCFLVKARKRAMDADIVVINHHLFFADSRLKEEGFGELLPGAEIVVFDEAHSLAEIAANFNGERWSTRQFRELVDDLLREWPVLDLPNQPLKNLSWEVDKAIDQLLLTLPLREERVGWEVLQRYPAFKEAWQKILALIDEFLACFENTVMDEQSALQRCLKRFQDVKALCLRFNEEQSEQIRWMERFKQSLVFHATPYQVAESFQKILARLSSTFVFTSATLTMASSFEYFIKPLGLEKVSTLLLPSPFNYQQQALLYLPRAMPDPKDPQYYSALVERALPLINACGGRCFLLFTSHKALKQVAELLTNNLKYPLLIQGEEAKPILLARFRALGNAVLLGTATFWEGVDVKGEALSCVIIDKLPFANPVDPVTRGKMAYLKAKGLSGFDELSLPNAVLALKQGVGRLIRDASDKGVLMIADPRLTGRDYGYHIFASLPSLRKTRDEQSVLEFINNLALKNEITSN